MAEKITTTSWGGRIINALWGILFGIALIFASIYLIFWNEGNGLHTAESLQQTREVLVSIPNAPVDTKYNLYAVYLSGKAETNDNLHDPLLNISETAIQLNRHIEMYQWQQDESTKTESQLGGSEKEVTTYTYKQVWSPTLINSANFEEKSGHQNPTRMPAETRIEYAQSVTVGDFNLPYDMIKEISGDKPVDLSKVDVSALKTKLNLPVQPSGEELYAGKNPDSPAIGDLRIRVSAVYPQTVSIIAQQSGTTLQPYMTKAGKPVSLLEMGQVSPEEMIRHAETENQIMTWLLRLAALIGLFIGFALILQPIVVLADVVPFFGSLVGFGTGLIAFICGLGVWTISVAIAWFAVRPLLASGMLVVTAITCYYLYSRRKNLTQIQKN